MNKLNIKFRNQVNTQENIKQIVDKVNDLIDSGLVTFDGTNLKDTDGNVINVGATPFENDKEITQYEVGDKLMIILEGEMNENDQHDTAFIIGNISEKNIDNVGNGYIYITGGVRINFVLDTMTLTSMINSIRTNRTELTISAGTIIYDYWSVSSALNNAYIIKL